MAHLFFKAISNVVSRFYSEKIGPHLNLGGVKKNLSHVMFGLFILVPLEIGVLLFFVFWEVIFLSVLCLVVGVVCLIPWVLFWAGVFEELEDLRRAKKC